MKFSDKKINIRKYETWPWDFVREDGKIHADFLKEIWTDSEQITEEWQSYKWMPGENGESVIDIGCGHARWLEYFVNIKKMNYAGLDNSSQMIKICNESYPNYKFIKALIPQNSFDQTVLPFQNDEFDLIFCHEVLRHLFQAERSVMPEFFRIAKKYVAVSQLVTNGPSIEIQHYHGAVDININKKEMDQIMDELAIQAGWSKPNAHCVYNIAHRSCFMYVFKKEKI